MIALLVMRVPIAFGLLFTAVVGLFVLNATRMGAFNFDFGWKSTVSMLGRDPYSFVASFTLMAIPMFLLMGNFAFASGATRDAYATARVWLARLPGGLACASVVACGLFAAISGSSLATAAAMGRIAVPEMLRQGYDPRLASGSVAAGGTLGALIPPSILMVIFGIFAEQSIGQLLIGGIVPGILTALTYVAIIVVRAKLNPRLAPPVTERFTNRDRLLSLAGTWQILLIFAVIITVIYTGIGTPTEAAAFGAAAVLVLGVLRGRIRRGNAWSAVRETVVQTAMIFAIAIASKVLVSFVAFTGVSADLATWAGSIEGGRIWVLLALTLAYVVLGMFMDPIGILLLTLPVVVPVVDALGYNLIWFGVFLVKLLEVGMITPPVGLNVFVLKSAIGNAVSLENVFRGIGPFLLMDIVTLAILIALPDLVLWLPNLMYG
ncbi:TRAP transporter large permease [Acuticoccus sediminis]|uniref:TRAP transporter large permease protein n=2 Tax=Acuticoccus sediminis TaxID=2184697 RepID=A0A8B2P163_9HYPH|nr:TRAP transporter large permease [Acuticoccus sediminis]